LNGLPADVAGSHLHGGEFMGIHTRYFALGLAAAFISWAAQSQAQVENARPSAPAASAPTSVPALVPYSGTVISSEARPLAGDASITFLIYNDELSGEPLFAETQNVMIDRSGRFKVELGSTLAYGLPTDLFTTGKARWLEVQIEGQKQQPRVLLTSVPYALKAADAATLGGLPASAFVLAGTSASTGAAIAPAAYPDATSTVTTTGGTANKLAKFSGSNAIVNSILYDNGTEVGIGTTTPTATLTVDGTMTVAGDSTYHGSLVLPAMGTATASTAYNSQLIKLYTSAYNSSTKAVVPPRFEWQATAKANNTTAPTATLNLLSSTTNASPAETGFSFNTNGTINFAAGQTFPGTGVGTITGVTAGTDLTGGGTTGHVTLNLDTTKVPSLAKANSFTGTQTILAGDLNLPATTSASSGVINIGGVPFLHGYKSGSANVFVGGAGNFTTKGTNNEGTGHSALKALTAGNYNTASGDSALAANTTGSDNAAFGGNALLMNTTGVENTAIGDDALFNSSTGSNNTAIGEEALFNNFIGSNNTAIGAFSGTGQAEGLTNATAIGYSSLVQQNNSLVLGMAQAGAPGAQFVNVGIGTSTPISTLEAAVSAPGALGPVLTLTNSGSGANTSAAIDFNTTLPIGGASYNPTARIVAVDDGLERASIYFLSNNPPGQQNNGLKPNMVVNSNGVVTIGDTTLADFPTSSRGQSQLEVLGSGDGGNNAITAISAETGGDEGIGGNGVLGYGAPGGGIGGIFVGGDAADDGGTGVVAVGGSLDDPSAPGFGAELNGNVIVFGTLTASSKDFKIDHPSDPANKYLVHASVESSEMMNIYSGNVTTDELGLATVTLPGWFEVLNTDFRYQLTTIGRDAHAWIAEEVAGKQFKIATNASRVKVSWQITAVRQDAYAKANPLVVEELKLARERGYYMHPELYGQPAEKQTEWARHPGLMRQVKAQRESAKRREASPGKSAAFQPQPGSPASAVNRQFAPISKPALKPVAGRKP
jgi:hypothetical protein